MVGEAAYGDAGCGTAERCYQGSLHSWQALMSNPAFTTEQKAVKEEEGGDGEVVDRDYQVPPS